MKKLLLLLTTLLTGAGTALATDYTVKVAGTPSTYGSFTTSSTVTDYYTTWTSNASSGLAGLTIVAAEGLGMSEQAGYNKEGGTPTGDLALKAAAESTDYDLVITAPSGYYIKGYSMDVRLYTSANSYRITNQAGGTHTFTTSSTIIQESAPYASSITLKVADMYSGCSSMYLCIVTFTVTLTDELPGTLLNSTADGVTWNPTGSWRNNWTSGTTPEVCLQAGNSVGASNISNSRLAQLQAHSTCTLSIAPTIH